MPPRNDFLASIFRSPDDAEPFLTRVKKVVVAHTPGNSNLVDNALGHTVWGEIRWHRGLGWPVVPRMADAFSVRFKRIEADGNAGPGGATDDQTRTVDAATPSVWDGPHDPENFRVSFIFHGMPGYLHQALVELRGGVDWEGTSPAWLPQARRLRYPSSLPSNGIFPLTQAEPRFLDEFVVVNGWY